MRWKGLTISKGEYEGRVCVLTEPKQIAKKLRKGDIVVCDDTNPEWALAFDLAGGFVTRIGSLLCHTAIIAREYKIPAVTQVSFSEREGEDMDGKIGKIVAEKGKPGVFSVEEA